MISLKWSIDPRYISAHVKPVCIGGAPNKAAFVTQCVCVIKTVKSDCYTRRVIYWKKRFDQNRFSVSLCSNYKMAIRFAIMPGNLVLFIVGHSQTFKWKSFSNLNLDFNWNLTSAFVSDKQVVWSDTKTHTHVSDYPKQISANFAFSAFKTLTNLKKNLNLKTDMTVVHNMHRIYHLIFIKKQDKLVSLANASQLEKLFLTILKSRTNSSKKLSLLPVKRTPLDRPRWRAIVKAKDRAL